MSKTASPGTSDVDWRGCLPVQLSPILQAALAAFYENGYSGASVRQIAARLGVTVPALYYHHRNKEMILFSLLDSSMDHVTVLCTSANSEAGASPGSRFLNVTECLVRYMAQSRELAYLDAESRRLSPELCIAYRTKRSLVEGILLRAVQDGIEAGVFAITDPATTTRALLGAIQAITTWYRRDLGLPLDDIVRSYLEIALRMVGARPELVSAAAAKHQSTV
jgi:AcrR family transcriptional regulator